MPKGERIPWTEETLAWCKENRIKYAAEPLTQAFNARFGLNINKQALKQYCTRNRIMTGRRGSEACSVWNKGTKGVCKRNSGTFITGNRPGNYMPVGSLKLTTPKVIDGVIVEKGQWWVKMGDPKLWIRLARLAWEAYNGPIPKGHVLLSIDQDPDNCCDPSNFELLSRAELVALNHRTMPKYKNASIEERRSLIEIARVNAKVASLKQRQASRETVQ